MIPRPLLLAALVATACARPSLSPWARSNPSWVEPVAPFEVVDGVYYVGTRGLSSFLITSDEGHFLLDGGLPENAPQIEASIRALGMDPREVRVLLNSHAHVDHAGGLAALKAATGAAMVASEADRRALETGVPPGHEDDAPHHAPPVTVDRTVADGETLTLGAAMMTAHLTPGHTPGCTSWSTQVADTEVLFFCSASVAANRLVPQDGKPAHYPGIIEAYRETFARTRDWRPDVFLASHPFFFDLDARRARQLAGEADAFVDATAFPAFIARQEAGFHEALAEQEAR